MSTNPKTSLALSPVVREIPADLETPVSAFLKLREHGAMFLLESVEHGESLGRYSFIGFSKLMKLVGDSKTVVVSDRAQSRVIPTGGENPLRTVRDLVSRYHITPHPLVPRLLGGAVGYIGYDYVRFLEKLPAKIQGDMPLPLFQFYLVDGLLVFDHVKRKMLLVALCGDGGSPVATRAEAEARVEDIRLFLRDAHVKIPPPPPDAASSPFQSNMSKSRFLSAVEKAKQHIRAGDIFQIVVSQRFEGSVKVHPFQVYRALRLLNPSPYMFYLDFGALQLVGSSPEVQVKLERGQATLSPIAGTRPRGASEEEDKFLQEELTTDEKERAEHVMLVDLARNDLGRVCSYGSIRVPGLFRVEKYSHVMHLVSEVTGTLREGLDAYDLFDATFPAGTVSGAPKVRAMELLEELEPCRRGPYAGAVGYFGLGNQMDMCIAIRTIVFAGAQAYLQAGAGIVADSVPENEFQETLNKIEGLKAAVAMAEAGF